jgi:hypothetical protein
MNYASRSYTAPSLRTSLESGSARHSDHFHRFARCLRIGLTENEKRDLIDCLSVLYKEEAL